jgi:hypothetical protein
MGYKYSDKHIKFLKKNIPGRTYAEMAELFEKRFGFYISVGSISWLLHTNGLCNFNAHKYTPEEVRFLKKNVKGRTMDELAEIFNKRFRLKLSAAKIRAATHNRKLWNGRDTRFKKGHVPSNKGKKGYCARGSEKGWFKKGQRPSDWRPVGSERVNVDGYVEIKVSDISSPDAKIRQRNWKMKHVVIWEAANGPVPKGNMIIFLNGNKLDMALKNLMMISRQAHAVMCHLKWYTNNRDVTKTNCAMAALKIAIADRKRKSFDDIKTEKMIFLDNNGKRVRVARVNGKDLWVPVRETKFGLRKLRAKIKARNSIEAAKRDLYEYALFRGWQRI